jgi:hypothetical protein
MATATNSQPSGAGTDIGIRAIWPLARCSQASNDRIAPYVRRQRLRDALHHAMQHMQHEER